MAGGPDDYSAVLVTRGVAGFERALIELADELEASGTPGQAALVRRAYQQLRGELEEIARVTAAKATEYIKTQERKTRVRPDTQGGGGPRLGDFVGESHPLPQVLGAVGINFEPALYDNVPWWWTNEEGYSGLVGKQIHGFFFDAGFSNPSRPSASEFRQHPLFMSKGAQNEFSNPDLGPGGSGPQGGSGGKGVIHNPIPARRFVQKGLEKAEAEWHTKVRAAKERCMVKVRKAATTPAPPRPSLRQAGRRRTRL